MSNQGNCVSSFFCGGAFSAPCSVHFTFMEPIVYGSTL